jgi:hypothetical protein
MKIKHILFLSLVLFFTSAIYAKSVKRVKTSDDSCFVQVSKIDSRYFELSNGSPFIPVGPNICFPRLILDEKLGFENIEMMYKNLAKYGANYTRIYLASDFFEIENQKQEKTFDDSLRFKKSGDLSDKELVELINYYRELDMTELHKKGRNEYIENLNNLQLELEKRQKNTSVLGDMQ